jgi:hypothetical protein
VTRQPSPHDRTTSAILRAPRVSCRLVPIPAAETRRDAIGKTTARTARRLAAADHKAWGRPTRFSRVSQMGDALGDLDSAVQRAMASSAGTAQRGKEAEQFLHPAGRWRHRRLEQQGRQPANHQQEDQALRGRRHVERRSDSRRDLQNRSLREGGQKAVREDSFRQVPSLH